MMIQGNNGNKKYGYAPSDDLIWEDSAQDDDIEKASLDDMGEDFLSEDELKYYL